MARISGVGILFRVGKAFGMGEHAHRHSRSSLSLPWATAPPNWVLAQHKKINQDSTHEQPQVDDHRNREVMS